ncbi:MAG: hypothetical protein LBG74_00985 [Spirochaetaceae bacterium]|jgi:hypothetical protein|nr:hypothetical protein [Spirochaetaceae bacterium]
MKKVGFAHIHEFARKRIVPWAGFFGRTAVWPLAALVLILTACMQPTVKSPSTEKPEETQKEEILELVNEVSVMSDNIASRLSNIKITNEINPRTFSMEGNQNADILWIKPQLSGTTIKATISIDNNWWGTYKGTGVWEWPETPGVPTEDSPGNSPPPPASETTTPKSVPFNMAMSIEIVVSGSSELISNTYLYHIKPYIPSTSGQVTLKTLSGRITGNLSKAFQGSNYSKTAHNDVAAYAASEKSGWIAKAVEAVDTSGTVIGSTIWTGGSMAGRYFTLPIMGATGSSLPSGIKYRVVFQKSGAAPHYSYPPAFLTEFAVAEAAATADMPYKHTIFPDEVMDMSSAAGNNSWLINGQDYEVPEDGKITEVILEAVAQTTGQVHIGLWRNAKNGVAAVKMYDETVNTVSGKNTFTVNWDAQKGDKIGVMIKDNTTAYVRVNHVVNGMALWADEQGNCTNDASKAAYAAVGVGYIFQPAAGKQFVELPVNLAVIPMGGTDSYRGLDAKSILKQIGSSDIFPLNGSYMLFSDIEFSGGEVFTPIGRGGGKNYIFCGNFYGNGHTIKNLRLTNSQPVSFNMMGIFGRVYGSSDGFYRATFADLNIIVDTSAQMTLSTSLDNYLGILAGDCYYGAEITNVHIRGNEPGMPLRVKIENPQAMRFGTLSGRLGQNTAGITNIITRCSNSLDVYIEYEGTANYAGHVGGLVGEVIGNGYTTLITSCYNDGAITAFYCNTTADQWSFTGGIVGRWTGGGNNRGIYDCYSTGKITQVHGGKATGSSFTISGPGAASPLTITYNGTTGKGYSRTGGIVGDMYDANSFIRRTYSAATIKQLGQVTSQRQIGGIAGWNNATNQTYLSGNVFLGPEISWEATSPTTVFNGRIARWPNNANLNYAWSGVKMGQPTALATVTDSQYNGTGFNLADFVNNDTKFKALPLATNSDWKFENNAGTGADGQTVAGRDWQWKLITGYPFPVLWWQANDIEQTGTKTGPDGGQIKYQWWETAPPAIDETWPSDATNTSIVTTLTIPHTWSVND